MYNLQWIVREEVQAKHRQRIRSFIGTLHHRTGFFTRLENADTVLRMVSQDDQLKFSLCLLLSCAHKKENHIKDYASRVQQVKGLESIGPFAVA